MNKLRFKKIRTNFPLRMWVDIGALSVPLFAIGMALDQTWALWACGIAVCIGFIGACFSIYHLYADDHVDDSPACKDIGMAATWVWPCILGGLICGHFGCESTPFYILAVIAMALIALVNHNDIL